MDNQNNEVYLFELNHIIPLDYQTKVLSIPHNKQNVPDLQTNPIYRQISNI